MATLPSIGRKTALRVVLQMLKWPDHQIRDFSRAFLSMAEHLRQCQTCFTYSDTEICNICSNPIRKEDQICVVESITDQLAIESTGIFKGRYHILGGLIAPVDGVGPRDLTIDALLQRLEKEQPREIILALNSSIEGEATAFYLYRRLQDKVDNITTLARGISFGHELEYTDAVTLGKSMEKRIPFSEPES